MGASTEMDAPLINNFLFNSYCNAFISLFFNYYCIQMKSYKSTIKIALLSRNKMPTIMQFHLSHVLSLIIQESCKKIFTFVNNFPILHNQNYAKDPVQW